MMTGLSLLKKAIKIDKTPVMPKKVRGCLIGQDGNAYSLMAYFSVKAKRQGWAKDEIDIVIKEAMTSDYDHLLFVLDSHLEPEDSRDDENYFMEGQS
jgi:hypothetical protein